VLRWLPSHSDRVRFVAVCRHWRIVAQQQRPLLPAPLPWINFNDDCFQSLCDGEQHAFVVPGKKYGQPKNRTENIETEFSVPYSVPNSQKLKLPR
jgi:hypothetical protein